MTRSRLVIVTGRLRRLLTDRWRLLSELPTAGWGPIVGVLVLSAVQSGAPIVNAMTTSWLVQRILDLSRAPRGSVGLSALTGPLAWVALVTLCGQAAQILREPVAAWIARRIDGHVRHQVRIVAARPPRGMLVDDPSMRDDIQRVSDRGAWREMTPGTGAVGQLWLLFRYASLLLAVGLLARFSVLLAVPILAVVLGIRVVTRRSYVGLVAAHDSMAASRRRQDYLSRLLTEPGAAKEVRLFGLADWLIDQRERRMLADLDVVWRRQDGIVREQLGVFAAQTGAALFALLWLGVDGARGVITPGELTTYLFALWIVLGFAGFLGFETYDIEWGLAALSALRRLRSRSVAASNAAQGGAGQVVPSGGRPPLIRFEQVRFAYRGQDRPVLDGLDFELRPGEVTAIVGANGAGKSTLINLLAGLHEPDAGRILIDGRDLAAVDRSWWRRQLTVAFQDFIRYELPVRDNVGLSAPEFLGRTDRIEQALAAAHATKLVAALPAGLDTPLARGYPGGTDLSGGQWQRLALARVLFAVRCGARVLVLDEPTASLDVRSELVFFEQLIAAVSNTSVVLISHRMSTVRQADRIVMIENGRVVESGDHDELMALDGRYAEAFRLQADRFEHVGAHANAPESSI